MTPPNTRPLIAYLARFTTGGSAQMLRLLLEGVDASQYRRAALFHTVRDTAYAFQLWSTGVRVIGLGAPWHPAAPRLSGLNPTARLSRWPRLRSAYQTARAVQSATLMDTRWQLRLARHLRELRPAVVHCVNGLRAHRLDLWTCAALGLPVICHMHSFETLTGLERLAARSVWKFVYVSRAVQADFERQGLPPERGLVIPNALPRAAQTAPEPLARAELGCGPEHFIVANVGRLVRWKGQDVFLRAAAQAMEAVPNLRAWVVGAPDDNPGSQAFAAELKALAAELGIADRVTFTGHRDDSERLMAAADVVVHSAVSPEPFGLVVLEAQAAERAVVATAAGGVLDIVEPEVNGLLVPPGAAPALAQSLVRLANSPDLRRRLGQLGRRQAQARFSAAEHVSRFEALYRECMGLTGAGASRGVPAGAAWSPKSPTS